MALHTSANPFKSKSYSYVDGKIQAQAAYQTRKPSVKEKKSSTCKLFPNKCKVDSRLTIVEFCKQRLLEEQEKNSEEVEECDCRPANECAKKNMLKVCKKENIESMLSKIPVPCSNKLQPPKKSPQDYLKVRKDCSGKKASNNESCQSKEKSSVVKTDTENVIACNSHIKQSYIPDKSPKDYLLLRENCKTACPHKPGKEVFLSLVTGDQDKKSCKGADKSSKIEKVCKEIFLSSPIRDQDNNSCKTIKEAEKSSKDEQCRANSSPCIEEIFLNKSSCRPAKEAKKSPEDFLKLRVDCKSSSKSDHRCKENFLKITEEDKACEKFIPSKCSEIAPIKQSSDTCLSLRKDCAKQKIFASSTSCSTPKDYLKKREDCKAKKIEKCQKDCTPNHQLPCNEEAEAFERIIEKSSRYCRNKSRACVGMTKDIDTSCSETEDLNRIMANTSRYCKRKSKSCIAMAKEKEPTCQVTPVRSKSCDPAYIKAIDNAVLARMMRRALQYCNKESCRAQKQLPTCKRYSSEARERSDPKNETPVCMENNNKKLQKIIAKELKRSRSVPLNQTVQPDSADQLKYIENLNKEISEKFAKRAQQYCKSCVDQRKLENTINCKMENRNNDTEPCKDIMKKEAVQSEKSVTLPCVAFPIDWLSKCKEGEIEKCKEENMKANTCEKFINISEPRLAVKDCLRKSKSTTNQDVEARRTKSEEKPLRCNKAAVCEDECTNLPRKVKSTQIISSTNKDNEARRTKSESNCRPYEASSICSDECVTLKENCTKALEDECKEGSVNQKCKSDQNISFANNDIEARRTKSDCKPNKSSLICKDKCVTSNANCVKPLEDQCKEGSLLQDCLRKCKSDQNISCANKYIEPRRTKSEPNCNESSTICEDEFVTSKENCTKPLEDEFKEGSVHQDCLRKCKSDQSISSANKDSEARRTKSEERASSSAVCKDECMKEESGNLKCLSKAKSNQIISSTNKDNEARRTKSESNCNESSTICKEIEDVVNPIEVECKEGSVHKDCLTKCKSDHRLSSTNKEIKTRKTQSESNCNESKNKCDSTFFKEVCKDECVKSVECKDGSVNFDYPRKSKSNQILSSTNKDHEVRRIKSELKCRPNESNSTICSCVKQESAIPSENECNEALQKLHACLMKKRNKRKCQNKPEELKKCVEPAKITCNENSKDQKKLNDCENKEKCTCVQMRPKMEDVCVCENDKDANDCIMEQDNKTVVCEDTRQEEDVCCKLLDEYDSKTENCETILPDEGNKVEKGEGQCIQKGLKFLTPVGNVDENDEVDMGLLKQCMLMSKKTNKPLWQPVTQEELDEAHCRKNSMICKVQKLGPGEKMVCGYEENLCSNSSKNQVERILKCSLVKDKKHGTRYVCTEIPDAQNKCIDAKDMVKVTSNKLVCTKYTSQEGCCSDIISCAVAKVEEIKTRKKNDVKLTWPVNKKIEWKKKKNVKILTYTDLMKKCRESSSKKLKPCDVKCTQSPEHEG